MTFVVMPEKKDKLFQLANERDVEISVIGEFTDSGYLDISYNDKRVAYLNMEFLHDGVPRKYMEAEYSAPELTEPILPVINDYNNIMKRMMGSFNICSRENVIRQYDHEVKGKSIIKPLMGNEGKNPQDAAVMRLNFDDYSGVAISNGICPKFSDLDAYEMSAGAFDEAVRQIISVGGKLPELENDSNRFWTVNDNFCVPDSYYDHKNNPDGKFKLAQLVQMNEALFDSSTFYNIPMTSGKDSMKNDFKSGGMKISVPPTILYGILFFLSVSSSCLD
jgi:phosphoribosylformylglycinamidine synthase